MNRPSIGQAPSLRSGHALIARAEGGRATKPRAVPEARFSHARVSALRVSIVAAELDVTGSKPDDGPPVRLARSWKAHSCTGRLTKGLGPALDDRPTVLGALKDKPSAALKERRP